MTDDERIDARLMRRLNADLAAYERRARREDAAERMIGELCREGRQVFYVWPRGGRYREGSRVELLDYLIRNNHDPLAADRGRLR